MRTVPPARPTRDPRSSWFRRVLGVIASLVPALLLGVLAWPHLGDAARGLGDVVVSGAREPALVKAPRAPLKVEVHADLEPDEAETVQRMLEGSPGWDVDVEMQPAPEEPILVRATEPVDRDEVDRGPAAGPVLVATPSAPPPEAEAEREVAAGPEPEVVTDPDVVANAEAEAAPTSGDRLRLEPPPPIVRRAQFVNQADASRASGPQDRTYRIQIAALPTREAARETWEAQRLAHQETLGELRPVIEHAKSGSHSFFRVQAGDLATLAEAQDVCEGLSRRGVACVVVRR